MSAVVVVGIDLGTQTCKAVVCDAALGVRGEAAAGYPTHRPRPGHAEQDPGDWLAALAPVVGRALAAAAVPAAAVSAIAIAGQLDGCVAVAADGGAVARALIWEDRRAVAEAARLAAAEAFAISGQVLDPSHLAPKLRWLRAHHPRAARFHQPVSFLVEQLTGEVVIDPALASTTLLFDLATGGWSARLLDAFEVDPRELPAIRPASARAGALTAAGARWTGLPVGTPVAVGTGDDFATPLGAGLIAPGAVFAALGTAEVVGALAATAVRDDQVGEPMLETHAYPGGGWLIENPGWLSGGAVRWASELLGATDPRAFDALAATAPPGADGATFVPALAGAVTPVWRPGARGTLHGLTAAHGRGHVARAVLEGLAFACREVCERLATLGIAVGEVALLGGGSRSPLWAQLRADVLGVPHAVAARADSCPVGAAMLAAVAAGLQPDLAAAAACAGSPSKIFAPAGDRDPLDAAYARYQRLVAQLAPLWEPAAIG